MRIIFCMMMLFFSFNAQTDATGVSELTYHVYVIPTAEPESAEIELFLKNEGDIPLNFEFPTSQIFDLSILNQAGREIYRYSKGRYFLQAFQTVRIEPHKTYKRSERWNYQVNGKRVPKGEYTVENSFKPTQLNDESIKDRGRLTDSQKMFVPEVNTAFRLLKVEGNKGTYVVTGETRTEKGLFFYTVEDGHVEYKKEKQVLTNGLGSDWHSFKLQIHLPEEKLPNNGSLILNLYERSKEKQIIHSYPLILEKFN
jgi:hypothetical protein